MPGACIPIVIEGAKAMLSEWADTQDRLCDLERATFPDFPYDSPHCRALYQLRYFPAYFVENHEMFGRLRRLGAEAPHIISLGCGCLVDAGAAIDVFGRRMVYDGYDINNWENMAVRPGNNIRFHMDDVFDLDSFPPGANVFVFSRSLGDIGQRLEEFEDILSNTELTAEHVFVCATYNQDDYAIDRLSTMLLYFAELLEDFEQIGDVERYHPAGQGMANVGFVAGRAWAMHPDIGYLRNLYRMCRNPRPNCPGQGCVINRYPILRTHHLAFEIIKLRRR